jgi:hypothetical protein
MQHRIDHAFAGHDGLTGARGDGLHDLIAVHFPVLQKPQDQKFGNACDQAGCFLRHVLIPWTSRYGGKKRPL